MWGDSEHLKKLKEQEAAGWPEAGKPLTAKEWKTLKAAEKGGFIGKDDLKAAERQVKEDRAALKRALEQDAVKGAKKAGRRPSPSIDLDGLKEAEWQAKADKAAWKAQQKALKATIQAEKEALKAQREADRQEQQWAKDEIAAAKKAQKHRGYGGYAATTWEAPAAPAAAFGCSSTATLALFVIAVVIMLALCICECGY